jgi:hypothetical protein
MSADDVISTVRAALTAGWTATPIKWPKEPFVQPRAVDGTPLPFILFDPDYANINRIAAGPVYNSDGYFTMLVFMPVLSGYGAGEALRVSLKALLGNLGANGMIIDPAGESPDYGKDSTGNYDVSLLWFHYRQWGTA